MAQMKRPLITPPQTDDVTFDELGETASAGPKAEAPVEPIAPAPAPVRAEAPEVTREQLHAALTSRVKSAEKTVEDAVVAQRENYTKERDGRIALEAARRALHKEFPPMTREQLVKQHLANETAKRAQQVRNGQAPSQLDALRRAQRGSYGRQGPGVYGASRDGISRQNAARMGMVVPGSKADLERRANATGVKA